MIVGQNRGLVLCLVLALLLCALLVRSILARTEFQKSLDSRTKDSSIADARMSKSESDHAHFASEPGPQKPKIMSGGGS